MSKIPLFNAFNWRVNCLLENKVDYDQMKADEVNQAANYNQNYSTHDVYHEPVETVQNKTDANGNAYTLETYTDRHNTYLLGQTKVQAFENYFQIKELKFDWDLSGTWTGYNRPYNPSWNTTHSWTNTNSITYSVGNFNSSLNQMEYIEPPYRACEIPVSQDSTHVNSSSTFYSGGFYNLRDTQYINTVADFQKLDTTSTPAVGNKVKILTGISGFPLNSYAIIESQDVNNTGVIYYTIKSLVSNTIAEFYEDEQTQKRGNGWQLLDFYKGYGNGINFRLKFNAGTSSAPMTVRYGNWAGFRFLGTDPFITKIPLHITDRGETFEGFTFACGEHSASSVSAMTFSGTIYCEIIRYDFYKPEDFADDEEPECFLPPFCP